MQIKCNSCGATQEILNTQNCNFCGSIINPDIIYEDNSQIIFDKNNSKIIFHEKSLEYTSEENQFLVLYKNIQSLKSSIFNPDNKIINPIYWQFFMGLGIFLICCFFYYTMIPHMEDKSQVVDGIYYNYQEKIEPSLGAFIFLILFPVLPILLVAFRLKKAHDNSKSKFIEEDQHFIQLDIIGVTSKKIHIGNKTETAKIFNLIKDKSEVLKMRQE